MILAPVVRARKGEYVKVFEDARRSGYVRVRVDGSMYELSEEIKLDKNKKHTIEVVVDRVVIKDGIMRRLPIPWKRRPRLQTASSLPTLSAKTGRYSSRRTMPAPTAAYPSKS